MSFMREQGAGNSSEHSPAATEPQGVPAGAPEAQEFLTVAASSKNVRRSTITVAILVAIGLVCLLFMIRKSQPQAAAAKQAASDETKIDAAIHRITGVRSEMVDRMEVILQKFSEFADVFQVKVHELVKNPFEVEGYMMMGLKGQAVVSEDPQVQAEMIRRQKMQEKAGTLRLLSIMRSDKGNSCMINDQILQQGQVIEGFTVVQIGSNSIELVWSPEEASDGSVAQAEDIKITLKLSE